ncbi:hypothetical protein CDAR_110441 [Caerostris darwini]|uniref:Uncharacterized protein n=1 Tax=Caerostris darwini TaxID=1538125 RepID=A0AAV4M5F5_9ARAC|nr:hypothetical protein CDAR_110441 [Caerostris darwini]
MDILCEEFDVLSSFHWRSDGTTDKLKTAQALVQRQDADSVSRFKIASNCRLTADLHRLIDESANTCMELIDSLLQSTFWPADVPTIPPQTATLTKH